jgi:predicted DNA-binding transcriptional regulator
MLAFALAESAHPWIRGQQDIPLDIMIYKLVKFYIRSTSVRRAALKVLISSAQIHFNVGSLFRVGFSF